MLGIGILIYLAITIAIGVWAGQSVRNTEDYLVAGRNLPLYLCTATVFATWFGAETLLGVSSEVARHGLIGAIEDPLGAALCLILVGLFFAGPLYRMNLLTFGDYFRAKYGPVVEVLAGSCLILSYLGWIAAQFVALGLLGQLVFHLDPTASVCLGAIIVTSYTFWGGMWAIAILDFLQIFVIIFGLASALYFLWGDTSWSVSTRQLPSDFFSLLPAERTSVSWLNYLAAWITIGLGSIPQQDVFQRVMSARSERISRRASYLGGLLYLTIGLAPLLLAILLRLKHPALIAEGVDPQVSIPNYVLNYLPGWIVLFFIGALISAIFSTAGAAILAPAAIFSENILAPRFPSLKGRNLLWATRFSVVAVSCLALFMALGRSNIRELVAESSALSLVSLFVPLVGGLILRKSSPLAAMLAILGGLLTWLLAMHLETDVAPMLYGFAGSILCFSLGQMIHNIRTR